MKLATNVVNRQRMLIMKTVPVRIDEQLVVSARKAAAEEFRSIQGQLEFWMKVGRAVIDNPQLPTNFVVDSLLSLNGDRSDLTLFVPRTTKSK